MGRTRGSTFLCYRGSGQVCGSPALAATTNNVGIVVWLSDPINRNCVLEHRQGLRRRIVKNPSALVIRDITSLERAISAKIERESHTGCCCPNYVRFIFTNVNSWFIDSVLFLRVNKDLFLAFYRFGS